jgi:hypothetical protein
MAFSGVMARLPRLHGRPPVTDRPISQLPRSMVLVLDDAVTLRAAIERAITFERGVALRTAENISRYEQMTGVFGRSMATPSISISTFSL